MFFNLSGRFNKIASVESKTKKNPVKQFISLNPCVTDHYTKPMNIRKKPSDNVRKCPVIEPIIIKTRVKLKPNNAVVTPLLVKEKKMDNINAAK